MAVVRNIKNGIKRIELVSELKNPICYILRFDLKDLDYCKNKVVNDTYIQVKSRVGATAEAAGKTLKSCIKTDFRLFSEQVTSNSRLMSPEKFGSINEDMAGDSMMVEKGMSRQESQMIEKTFTPEDAMITEELYCLWLTE